MSTLAYYYDVNAADRFESLFGGTYIGSHPTSEKNKHMVMRFDFSQLALTNSMEGLEKNFNDLLCPAINMFVKGRAHCPRFFEGFGFRNMDSASQMLSNILDWVTSNALPPLYILIDEYDNFTNQLLTTYKNPLYESVTTGESFLRTFFKVIKRGIGEGCQCCGKFGSTSYRGCGASERICR